MNSLLRRSVAVVAAVAALVTFSAWHSASAQPGVGGLKIGVVDLGKLGDALQEAKEINATLKAKHDEAQVKLDEVVNQLKQVQKDAELETDHKGAHWRELLVKAKELETLAQARKSGLEQVFDFEKGIVTAEMYTKISEGVRSFGVQENYDLILVDDSATLPPRDQGSAVAQQYIQSRQVLFAAKRMDISDQVATFMNNKFKAGAGAAPAVPAATGPSGR